MGVGAIHDAEKDDQDTPKLHTWHGSLQRYDTLAALRNNGEQGVLFR